MVKHEHPAVRTLAPMVGPPYGHRKLCRLLRALLARSNDREVISPWRLRSSVAYNTRKDPMKTRFSAAFAVVVLMFALLAATANAGTQGGPCFSFDTSEVRLYENASGDTSDGNDVLVWCSDQSNLANVNHTLAGNCNNGNFGTTTWNDCISSFNVEVQAHGRFCAYWGSGYGASVIAQVVNPTSGSLWSGRTNFAPLNRDALSSFRWIADTASC